MDYRNISDYDKLKNTFIDIGVGFEEQFDEGDLVLVVDTIRPNERLSFNFYSNGSFGFVTTLDC